MPAYPSHSRRLPAPVLALVASGALACAACGEPAPRFASPQTLGGMEVSAATLNQGHRLYTMRCASCHGHDGSGQGPATTGLPEKPRDFRSGKFRYKSTPGDALPTDQDLDRLLRQGRPKAGMPAWPHMPKADRVALIHYLKTFSPRWATGSEAAHEAS